MMEKLKILQQINILKTIYYTLKAKSKIFIYMKTKIKLKRNSKLKLGENIFIGKPYESCNTSNTTFLLNKNAKFTSKGKICIGTGTHITVAENAQLTIESGIINRDTKIYCFDDIYIGKNVAIAEDVLIRDSDSHYIEENNKLKDNTKPIVIEDHVWIGAKCIILKGVHIGKNCVIAAGSVVTADCPANSLVAGCPAQVKKKNINWKL